MPQAKKPEISKLKIALNKDNDNSVEIVKWFGDNETRYDLIIRTANSSTIHSLTFQQLKLIKDAIREVI